MKPVKCAYCGAAEWRHVCGGVANAPGIGLSPVVDVANKMANAKGAVANEVVSTTSSTYRYRDAEARRVYQRELMRARRAKVQPKGMR